MITLWISDRVCGLCASRKPFLYEITLNNRNTSNFKNGVTIQLNIKHLYNSIILSRFAITFHYRDVYQFGYMNLPDLLWFDNQLWNSIENNNNNNNHINFPEGHINYTKKLHTFSLRNIIRKCKRITKISKERILVCENNQTISYQLVHYHVRQGQPWFDNWNDQTQINIKLRHWYT